MRVLFGIISCGENEYKSCLSSARSQKKIDFDIFEVKNKRKKDAHDELYAYFMKSKKSFDYFVKLDADMILRSDDIIYKLCGRLRDNKMYKSLEITIFDHLTKSNIWGLHIYRNSYVWDFGNEKHFTDKIDAKNQLKLLINNPNDPLVPAADHCPNPSLYQCFHFGVHKATKVLQYNRKKYDFRGARSHYLNYNKLYNLLKSNPKNENLNMTIQGFHWAVKHDAKPELANYDNHIVRNSFKKGKYKTEIKKINFCYLLFRSLKHRFS